MTVQVPPELEQALATRAQEREMSSDELVREALSWYLQFGSALMDDLAAWQEVRDEAFQRTEDLQP